MIIRGAASIELRCSVDKCRSFISINRIDHAPTDEDEAALLSFARKRGWCEDLCPKCQPPTHNTPT